MHRFFVSPEHFGRTTVLLDEGESRHATRVLRLGVGGEIELLDGAGRCAAARLVRADRSGVEAEVLTVRQVPRPPAVGLAAAVLKGRAMDFLVQKATELGVAEIHPLLTERTVVRIGAGEAEEKVAGWRSTAIEACKQCGNPWLPRFHPPVGLREFVAKSPGGLMLVAALAGAPRFPGEVLRRRDPVPAEVTVIIGPEGDLTAEELAALIGAGAVPITLGSLVLRGETAAVASLAIVQHELRMLGRGSGVDAFEPNREGAPVRGGVACA